MFTFPSVHLSVYGQCKVDVCSVTKLKQVSTGEGSEHSGEPPVDGGECFHVAGGVCSLWCAPPPVLDRGIGVDFYLQL